MRKMQLNIQNIPRGLPGVPDIDYSQLDPNCVELVHFFNSHGLPTAMCCQGHDTPEQSLFWVSFDSAVTLDDILAFQSNYLNRRGNFCSCGHFGKRVYLCTDSLGGVWREGTVYEVWEYVAASAEVAHTDLQKWKDLDSIECFRSSPGYYIDSY